jgi:hypothetical protein
MVVFFEIGLLILAFIFDNIFSSILRKSEDCLLTSWSEIYAGNLKHDVLIMGNSRAWEQYSPVILDSILGTDSYNLGIRASLIDRQILKYDTYRRFNEKPVCIIQNIDIWTIGLEYGNDKEQFFPYFFDNTFVEKSSETEHWTWMEKYIPCYRYIGYGKFILKNMLGKGERKVSIKGYWGNPNTSWDGTKIPKDETEYAQNPTALLLFDKYLTKVKSENIKMVFVYAPFHILGMQKIKNVKGMFLMYDSIAKKHDIPVLNYTYDAISYDTCFFYNASHLNKVGAEIFTRKLASDLDSLGIIK